jgi:ArsR family transcriptional regulator
MSLMIDLVNYSAALADLTRLRLLHLMKDGEICVCVLQEVLQTNQPKISRHLAYLKRVGLVTARRHGKWTYYSLKSPDRDLGLVFAKTLSLLGKEPRIRADLKRLINIACSPMKYGASKGRRSNKPVTVS